MLKNLKKINDYIWEIQATKGMKVPGRIFCSSELLNNLENDVFRQISNVAMLPGIQKYSMAMPDAHTGYGFPIGGVAAFDKNEGVISPGGVGYDINCGVRMIKTNLTKQDIQPKIKELVEKLFKNIPLGVGSKNKMSVSENQLTEIFVRGAKWVVDKGYGFKEDYINCEENGAMEGADPSVVSKKAYKRGRPQIGTLGSGNHFLEIQYIDEIYDKEIAKNFGLFKNQVIVMIHCGSRGAGHQICTDNLKVLGASTKKYGINVPDKQLACAPAQSTEAQNYFKGMICACNYAWANRQMLTHLVREIFTDFFKKDIDELGLSLLYDVAHNVAKLEEHVIDGEKKEVYVHRKGATRAFPPNHSDIPKQYKKSGQPVLIPGSMGTPSYVLHGTDKAMELSFGSACHGSGRVSSRSAAKRLFKGQEVQSQLEKRNIIVMATSPSVISQEAPGVYKSSDDVVDVIHNLEIAKKVVKALPLGVIKG